MFPYSVTSTHRKQPRQRSLSCFGPEGYLSFHVTAAKLQQDLLLVIIGWHM